MKTRNIITTLVLLIGAGLYAVAAPPTKSTYTSAALRTTEDFNALRKGDAVAMVCTECSTVTVKQIESQEDAMALCKDGETVVCGSCKEEVKIVRHGPRSKSSKRAEIRYLNEKGEDCMFVAKLES